ncbi:hypothetical protein [Pseudonocardia pini]|uniref:hypothetical protein n=1 Tax=Pseudonocardia pini TaxID=2758030 RepID=UPI0015F0BCAF|nr:hypothetical protein [Pseudonocardia pini]
MSGPGPETDALALAVAEVVVADPAVARLDGGVFGDVATHLAGRKLVGVRVDTDPARPVEVGVVLHLGTPIPVVVAGLRARVARVVGARPVDLTVSDVVPGPVDAMVEL